MKQKQKRRAKFSTSTSEDPIVRECEKRIAAAKSALTKAWIALDSVNDGKQRANLEYQIINIGGDAEIEKSKILISRK